MTDNDISFEDEQPAGLGGTLFGTTATEQTTAHIVSRIEFYKAEHAIAADYVECIEGSDLVPGPDEASASSSAGRVHLADLLSNYCQLLDEQIAFLEYEQAELDGRHQST
jgi:hypothetical protein